MHIKNVARIYNSDKNIIKMSYSIIIIGFSLFFLNNSKRQIMKERLIGIKFYWTSSPILFSKAMYLGSVLIALKSEFLIRKANSI